MYRKIILFVILINPFVLSKPQKIFKNSEDVIRDIGWLFDIEGVSENKIKHKDNSNICETDGCKFLAKEIKKGMNKTVNPCDDFYEYMCGEWESKITIPSHLPSWGRMEMFQAATHERMKGILETKAEPNDILPVRQAKKWYRACMNINNLEKLDIKPLESILMQIGGWPMTMDDEEWDENDHTWQNVERYYFDLTGSYIFYDIEASYSRSEDPKDSHLELTIGSGDIPLSSDFPEKYRNYTGNDYDAYIDLIEGVVREFIEHNRADIKQEVFEKNVRDVVEFEKKLYMFAEDLKYSYEETTVGEVVESYNSDVKDIDDADILDIRSLIKRVFTMGKLKLKDSTPIYTVYDNYLAGITKVLSETPKKTIINYIHWHFISNMLRYTSEKMRALLFKLKETKYGVKERPPRWYECVEEIRMEHATSYAFVQKYFPKKTETAALKMIEHIHTEMESQIENSYWMDDESKKLAIEKLNTMKIFVGFPDWYRNKTAVINSYKGLNIGTNYIDNVLSFQRYSTRIKLQKQKNDDGPWDVSPTLVNAMYAPFSNEIIVPAADFQPPLFTTQLPDNVNYGMTGVVIGHEIGHAFDDTGIRYGNDGNETKLSKKMMELYYKRAECFLDQFNEYYGVTEPIYEGTTPDFFYDDVEISMGRRTRGENIADTTGLHSVFEAYRKMLKKKSQPDIKLPGFEGYTDEQMFFISFGAMWCGADRPEYTKSVQKRDPHSPNRLRVIGAVSNTNDFSKAFKCPKGSSMNPDDKCNIWKSLSDTNTIDDRQFSFWPHGKKRQSKWLQKW